MANIWLHSKNAPLRVELSRVLKLSKNRLPPGDLTLSSLTKCCELLEGKLEWGPTILPFSELKDTPLTNVRYLKSHLVASDGVCDYAYNLATKQLSTPSPTFFVDPQVEGFSMDHAQLETAEHIIVTDPQHGFEIRAFQNTLYFEVFCLKTKKRLFCDHATRRKGIPELPLDRHKWERTRYSSSADDDKEPIPDRHFPDTLLYRDPETQFRVTDPPIPEKWTDADEREEQEQQVPAIMKKNRGKSAFIENIFVSQDGFCISVRLNRAKTLLYRQTPHTANGHMDYEWNRYYNTKSVHLWRVYYDNCFNRLGITESQLTPEQDMDKFVACNLDIRPLITTTLIHEPSILHGQPRYLEITADKKTRVVSKRIKEAFDRKYRYDIIIGRHCGGKRLRSIPGSPFFIDNHDGASEHRDVGSRNSHHEYSIFMGRIRRHLELYHIFGGLMDKIDILGVNENFEFVGVINLPGTLPYGTRYQPANSIQLFVGRVVPTKTPVE